VQNREARFSASITERDTAGEPQTSAMLRFLGHRASKNGVVCVLSLSARSFQPISTKMQAPHVGGLQTIREKPAHTKFASGIESDDEPHYRA
jgi:hypothetical protein